MTGRVDFYVLSGGAQKAAWTFACRLAEKAYLRDLRVLLCGETAVQVDALDDLLWTFNDRSFVPHRVCRDDRPADPGTPVHLTWELGDAAAADVLVNLSNRMPPRPERFPRIAEIIDDDAERRRLGRERFTRYRELEMALETHRIDDAAGP